jgi:hypothetical protein
MSVQLEERVALLEAEVERLKHQILPTPVKTEHPMLKFAGIFICCCRSEHRRR